MEAEEQSVLDRGRAVASHLAEIGTQGSFVLMRVQVSDGRALMLYEDVNGSEYAR